VTPRAGVTFSTTHGTCARLCAVRIAKATSSAAAFFIRGLDSNERERESAHVPRRPSARLPEVPDDTPDAFTDAEA